MASIGIPEKSGSLGILSTLAEFGREVCQKFTLIFVHRKLRGGGGGKALTMTMTPWNLPHGQWSKKLTMTMTPSILAMVMVKIG